MLDYNNNANLYSALKYENTVDKLSSDKNNDLFLKDYNNNKTLINYNSTMNKIYQHTEKQLSPLKKQGKLVNEDIIKLLKTNTDPLLDYDKINYIKKLSDKYYEQKSRFKKGINNEYNNIDQVAKSFRESSLCHFDNAEELANYVVEVCYIQRYHQSKSFAWNVFGQFLLENLKKNSGTAQIPIRDESGDITYLFNKYKLIDIDKEDI